MPNSFTITTTATEKLTADAKGHAEALFTVTNATQRAVRGMARPKALGDTKREWLSIAGESDRDFGGGTTEQFTVSFDAPTATAGKYPFRLDVASFSNPDEDYTQGPTINVEVPGKITPPPPSFPKWIFLVIAAIVLVVGGLVSWLLWGRNSTPVKVAGSYSLPDVEDTSEEKAKQRLEGECTGSTRPCVRVDIQRVIDDRVPRGRTIRTEPGKGEEVPVGSKVVLFTSLGPLIVPAVANQPAADAEKRLRETCDGGRCTVAVQQRNDDKVPPGVAIGTEPRANTPIQSGATVTLIVSSGAEMLTVGKYTGLSPDEAQARIIKDGFTLGEVTKGVVRDHRFPPILVPIEAPVVWRQNPSEGGKQPRGSKIDIMIRIPG